MYHNLNVEAAAKLASMVEMLISRRELFERLEHVGSVLLSSRGDQVASRTTSFCVDRYSQARMMAPSLHA